MFIKLINMLQRKKDNSKRLLNGVLTTSYHHMTPSSTKYKENRKEKTMNSDDGDIR